MDQDVLAETEKPSVWIQKHFLIPDPRDPVTGERFPPGPIRLAEHQCRIIDEALSRKEDGTLKYSTVIYSATKKSGKSALSSAIVLYMAQHNPNAYAACVANDGKQADDRLYGPITTCFRLHRQLGGIFKDIHYTQREVRLDNYTKIEPINVDAAGEAGSQPLIVAWSEIWGYTTPKKHKLWCYDDQTQALTKDGWKYCHELTSADKFATLNPDTHALEWQYAKDVHTFDYDGELHVVDSRDMSIAVTPGHTFYGKSSETKWKGCSNAEGLRPIEEIIEFNKFGIRAAADEYSSLYDGYKYQQKVTIPGTACLPETALPIVPYLRLLGWYLAEGWVDKRRRKDGTLYSMRVNIAQTTEPYVSILEEDIKRTGLAYSRSKDGFRINDVRLAAHFAPFGTASEKYIPGWVIEQPEEYLWEFIKAYHLGDGGKTETTWTFFTVSEALKDGLADIGVRLRTRVRVSTIEPKNGAHSTKYRVVFSVNGGKHRWVKKKHWKKRQYKGVVWCPSLPNGIFMVRRRETYYFGGNTEMTIPPTLYGHALRWVESYAGFTGESEILEQLYDVGFIRGTPHPDFEDLQGTDGAVVRVNPAAGMFVYWDTEPRMIWQTDAYYQNEAQILPASEFRRIHRNQWSSPSSSFIEASWWDACEDVTLPMLHDKDHTPMVVGIDMAVSRDCAALIGVTRDPLDPTTSVAVRTVKIFSPKQTGGIIDQEMSVRPVMEDWYRRFNIICWAYDPKEMAKLAQDMTRDGFGWFKPFGQTNPRAVSDKQLHDMIVHRQLTWNRHTTEGNVGYKGDAIEETLYKHMTQAGAVTTGDSYRLEKLTSALHIDGAVALSQAAFMCMYLTLDNREGTEASLIRKLQRGKITQDEFLEGMQALHRRLNKKEA